MQNAASGGAGSRRRRVLCAPDSFKESISAAEAAAAMVAGIRRLGPDVEPVPCPVADGGEGTLDAVVAALPGTIERVTVAGPLGEPVAARLGLSADGSTAVVELAEASGLVRIPPARRDPTTTTTYGTGQLIRHAYERGWGTVIVGLGGSGTVDGGTGLAQALGVRFFDQAGQEISDPLTGGMLGRIARYERPGELPRIRVACDVTNPLCGPTGAAAVYGPQKGATPQQVGALDEALRHLAGLGTIDPETPGAGAAGGAAYGLLAFCGARLERGIELVLDAVGFRRRCRSANLVLTGEGCLDEQSLHGKASLGVAAAAGELGVATIAIVGTTGPGADRCVDPALGGALASYVSLSERFGRERALREPAELIAEVAAEVAGLYLRDRDA